MYKIEPAVADGGEVVIYAPHVTEVSYVHGKLLDEVGYHCRDYFLAQWDRFKHYPGGILAHSTHVKGLGTFDASCGARNAADPGHAGDRHSAGAMRADQSRLPGSGNGRPGGMAAASRLARRAARGRNALPGRSAADVGRVRLVHADVRRDVPEADSRALHSRMTMTYKMGVVGLGVMGASLARNIESKGFPVVGYDLDAKKTQGVPRGTGEGQGDHRRRSARAADGSARAAAARADDGAGRARPWTASSPTCSRISRKATS